MKIIIIIFLLLSQSSCIFRFRGRDLEVEKSPLARPSDFDYFKVKVNGEYANTTDLFTVFFWPDQVKGKDLYQLVSQVSNDGIKMDNLYQELFGKYMEKSGIESKIAEVEQDKQNELIKLLSNYTIVDEENSNKFVPTNCFDLFFEPWNDEEKVDSCDLKYIEIEDQYDKEIDVLDKETRTIEDKVEKLFLGSSYLIEQIQENLEEDTNKVENFKNWILTKNSFFEHIDEHPFVKFKLEIRFNIERDDKTLNRYLIYSSESDIDQLDLRMEDNVPTLIFRLYQKKWNDSQKVEERTGVYYLFKLRRSVLDYGLQYQGDVTEFDIGDIEKREGKVKIMVSRKH